MPPATFLAFEEAGVEVPLGLEKARGMISDHGEIDATLKSDTRVLTCIMEASSGSGWLD